MPVVNYLWNPLNDNIVREFDDSGTVIAEYTTEANQFGNVISQRRNGQDSVYHYDGQGSTLALTDANGDVTDTYAYSAFGEVTAHTGSTVNPFQYIGQKQYYRDGETGEYEVRRRTYEAAYSRWLTRDPDAFVDGTNQYKYVLNLPTLIVDPSGMSLCVPDPAPCKQKHPDLTWYGCFCGPGNPPPGAPKRGPIDPVDNSCVDHDNCYVANGCVVGKVVFFPIPHVVFDAKPACIQCDRTFCRALRIATCNRYPPGSRLELDCLNYRRLAMAAFNCMGRFGIPPLPDRDPEAE